MWRPGFFLAHILNIFHKDTHNPTRKEMSTMNLDKTVCYCRKVTYRKVKEAVDSGASTLEEVQKMTGAGTVCKKCCENLQRLVEEFVAEKMN